jgi:DNA-binding transcriptional regulator YhcF (GntR family)
MKNITKIDINKLHSIKSFADKHGVSTTAVQKWYRNKDSKGTCKNDKYGVKFKPLNIGGLKLILDLN